MIPIEMPAASSPVNAYLIEDSPLTLLDTGPNLPDALIQLERGLRALGHRVEDLQRIVLTHPHIDHVGLASILRGRSGAEVSAPAGAETWLREYQATESWMKTWRDSLMLLHGVPQDLVREYRHGAIFRDSWDASVAVDRVLQDGDAIPFTERTWTVMSRPGHSPFDIVLCDAQRRHLLVGDHIIEHISSNALITPAPGQSVADRPHALAMYRRSLRQTAEVAATLVLSGHGSPIVDHRGLIERRLASMDQRTRRIGELIQAGPRTAHQLALAIWGERAIAEAWLTLSEVLGHVDRLISVGRVREVRHSEQPIRLEPARRRGDIQERASGETSAFLA